VIDAGGRDERLTGLIVNHLGIDLSQAAIDIEARLIRRSGDILPHSLVTPLSRCIP
jgi:hypothetical protein